MAIKLTDFVINVFFFKKKRAGGKPHSLQILCRSVRVNNKVLFWLKSKQTFSVIIMPYRTLCKTHICALHKLQYGYH